MVFGCRRGSFAPRMAQRCGRENLQTRVALPLRSQPRTHWRRISGATPHDAVASVSHKGGVWSGVSRTRPDVYELCGRGRAHLLSASMFEVPKAVEAFQAAVALDPSYPPAHAGWRSRIALER